MARRKQNEFFELLVLLPWWVTTIIAIIGFVLLRWVLPAIEYQSIMFAAIAPNLPAFSWVWLLFSGFAAVMSLSRQVKSQWLLAKSSSGESLGDIGWLDFELLVQTLYQSQGYSVIGNLNAGADGGIDLRASKDGQTILIQCKHWKTRKVGVAVVREMFGIMTSERFSAVHIVCSGYFTKEAQAYAIGKPIALIDGEQLQKTAQKHNPSKAAISAAKQTEPELVLYQTEGKGCPRCGNHLVKRVAKKGSKAGRAFFGCSSFPKCRYTQAIDG